jgi:hypothetical protein
MSPRPPRIEFGVHTWRSTRGVQERITTPPPNKVWQITRLEILEAEMSIRRL